MNFSWRSQCNKCQAARPSCGGGSSSRLSGGLGGSYNCGSGDYGSGGGGGFKRDVEDYNSGPREELGMIPMAVKSPGKELRSSSAFGMQEEAVSQSNPVEGGEVSVLDESVDNGHRSNVLEWVEAVESSKNLPGLPRFDIVLFPGTNFIDIYWGWGWDLTFGIFLMLGSYCLPFPGFNHCREGAAN